jgi:hypothetical protein
MHRATLFSALGFVLAIASCGGKETGSSSGTAGGTTTAGGAGGTAGAGGATGGGGSGGAATTASSGGGGTAGGTGGSGGSGGTTSGTECTPGTVEECYSGAPETKDVGICKAGQRACKADGLWGVCVGEVTPIAETCDSPNDEDCDGQTNEEGQGCVCLPGTMAACYSGPPGTQDVGTCKSGMGLCDAEGKGVAACAGQVLPAAENCLAPSDENCDGVALTCAGTDFWHKKFGDAGVQTGGGIAAWNGGAVIAGSFEGTVDFGGGALVSAGAADAFLASYDYLGAHMWSKQLGDAVAQTATGVAVDAAGNVYVVGDFAGKIDLGGGDLTSAGVNDVFIAKYDVNGGFLWGKAFGNNKAQAALAVAVDAQGRVAMTGSFVGDVVLGVDLLVGAGGNDAFVAVFDTDGGPLWSKGFGDPVAQVGKAIAMGPQGEVVVLGDMAGTVDFGGGALTSAGVNDVFVAAFDKAGAPLWSKVFGDVAAQAANGVAIDSVGNVVMATTFAGKIDFGGGLLTSAGSNDVGLAKLTATGMHLWSKRLGGTSADVARGVAIDPFGAISLTGQLAGTADLGGGGLVSAGGTDVFVAKYDALGAHVWSHRAGDAGAQVATGVATDISGTFATGTFAGAIDFGGGALTSAGGNDVFLVKLGP